MSRLKFGRSSGKLFAVSVQIPLGLRLLGLPLPALFRQGVSLRLQAVFLRCQGVLIRLESGQSGSKLFAVGVQILLGLLLLALPLPALFRQGVLLGLQAVPLRAEHASFGFKLGQSGSNLFAVSVQPLLGLLLLGLPLPVFFRQGVSLGFQIVPRGGQGVSFGVELRQSRNKLSARSSIPRRVSSCEVVHCRRSSARMFRWASKSRAAAKAFCPASSSVDRAATCSP